MRTAVDDCRDSAAAFELAAGCAAVIVAAFAAAAAFGHAEQAGRVLIMAVTAGLLAAVLRDWRACTGVVTFAALVYVGFLAHRSGQLSGDPAPWPHTLVFVFAALLGRVRRWALVPRHNAVRPPVSGSRALAPRTDRPGAHTRPHSVRS